MKITFGHGLTVALGDELPVGFVPACSCVHLDVWPQDKSPEGYAAAYAQAFKEFFPEGRPEGCPQAICQHRPNS